MQRRSRIALWMGLMIAAVVVGLIAPSLAYLLADLAFKVSNDVGAVLLVVTLALTWVPVLVALYYAAKAAAWAQLRGDIRTLVLGWWLVGGLTLILAGVVYGDVVHAIVSAATLGVVRFRASGGSATPEWLVSLGAARRFGLRFPYALVLLVGFYLLAQRRMRSVDAVVAGAGPAGRPPA